MQFMIPSKRVLGKRRRSRVSEPEEEVDDELDNNNNSEYPLPTIPQLKNMQIWSSARNCKKSRHKDDSFKYY
jgi:hypothetical protein